jgi:hypothetical protein
MGKWYCADRNNPQYQWYTRNKQRYRDQKGNQYLDRKCSLFSTYSGLFCEGDPMKYCGNCARIYCGIYQQLSRWNQLKARFFGCSAWWKRWRILSNPSAQTRSKWQKSVPFILMMGIVPGVLGVRRVRGRRRQNDADLWRG